MHSKTDFYISSVCFRICETESECHQHKMILCHTGEPGDERRKPVINQSGNPVSRAPRWYLEALGWIEVT